ncbi:deoxyuridine 5'-triphosphate nucleotidohydrolase-like [Triticum dicoccoides]|uniref:deoxyuridine 5'-triphosphate nucleotidohydrolase-like n=1 Tax=Triticum dicoccoides TaxID=85692 RepID=UPI00189193D7|nr:deoxyuridine 5'-triphosphate nucleotidohydrolase-like [Triticum dicoccoides]
MQQPPSSMDEDNHHGTHVVEFSVAYSGAVLDQGPPPQQILAWINLFGCSVGSPIICCSKSDKLEEECARSNSIINGKLNEMNHTCEEPPRRSNSSVQVDRWASSTLLATRMYEGMIDSLDGPDANMPMRLRATNRTMNSRFCRIQRVAKAGCMIDADYRGPVGSVLFNDLDVDFAVKTGDRVAQMIIQMFTIVSMNAASVKDGSVT